MATIDENIRKIRSEAIYGTDIREAIAEGLEQTGNVLDNKIVQYKNDVSSIVTGYVQRLNSIEQEIEVRDLFIQISKIQDDDYKAIITGSVG